LSTGKQENHWFVAVLRGKGGSAAVAQLTIRAVFPCGCAQKVLPVAAACALIRRKRKTARGSG